MGLKQLEWHEQQCRHTGRMGWVVRLAIPYDTNPERVKYRRFAHVDILPDWARRVKGKNYVELFNGSETDGSWHDSVEAAKLYVEAMFALSD